VDWITYFEIGVLHFLGSTFKLDGYGFILRG